MSELWTRYFDAAGEDPRPTLLAALDLFDAEPNDPERLAVDLGCGTGRDTFELLRRGWRVLAIDAQEEAIRRLLQSAKRFSSDRLETQVAEFASAQWLIGMPTGLPCFLRILPCLSSSSHVFGYSSPAVLKCVML